MRKAKTFDHSGSSFDSFLVEETILEQAEAVALKRVLAWKLQNAMKEQKVSKYALAKELRTSRSQVDRLLDPSHIGVSIGTITRAAMKLGKRLQIEILSDVKPSKSRLPIRPHAPKPRRQRMKMIAACAAK